MSEEAVKKYTPEEIFQKVDQELPNWKYEEGYLTREFITKNWKETTMLFNAIAYMAEALWHHPDVELGFKRLKIKLKTHEFDGITDRDFRLAKLIENFLSMV
ncbi:4a-hydroxytetrahydrobiopterin dehydratase [Thermocrinis sp.]